MIVNLLHPYSAAEASSVSAVDFDVEGLGWQWGPYTVQSMRAQGGADADEGLRLRRLELR